MYLICEEEYGILAGRAGQKGTVVGIIFDVNEYFLFVMRFLLWKRYWL
jgi:hypothetical protein